MPYLLHVLVALPVALDVFVSLPVTVTDDAAVSDAVLLGLMLDVSVAVSVSDVEALAELLSDILFISEPVADDDDVTACVSGPAAVKLVSLVLFETLSYTVSPALSLSLCQTSCLTLLLSLTLMLPASCSLCPLHLVLAMLDPSHSMSAMLCSPLCPSWMPSCSHSL